MDTFNAADTALIIGMVIVYIIFTSWLSVKLRSKTNDQFMTAARSMPAVVVGVLLMTEYIGAKSTVGTAQSAFKYGAAASWSVIAAAIGFLLFGLFFVKKLYKSGEFTISGAIAQKYGNSTKIIVSLVMIYALLLVNVGNYISGAAAISTVLKVNIPVAMCIIGVVSTFYYVLGGMKGVAYVTILHTGIKYLGVMIILGVGLSLSGGIAPVMAALPDYYFTFDGKIGFNSILAWIIATGGSIFSTQFVVQAISSTKSAEDAKKSCFYAAALCVPLALALGFIGVLSRYLYPDMNSLYALPIFVQKMSPWVAGLVTTSLVAAVFVSVSTVALGIASLVVQDFYVPYFKPSPEKQFKMTRVFSIIIGFLPLLFVFVLPEILKLSFFTRALRLSIAVVAMIGFYLPFFNSARGANAGLIGAAVATTAWYLLNDPFGIDDIYIALITPAIVMVIERVLFPNHKKTVNQIPEEPINK
jgi:solute:Na+ symporter, SSS family